MIIQYNPNPNGKFIGDCVIRAITAVTGKAWHEVYVGLCLQGYIMADLPSSNAVWAAYLRNQGFIRKTLPNDHTQAVQNFHRLLTEKISIRCLQPLMKRLTQSERLHRRYTM